jgi:hypothetical protein
MDEMLDSTDDVPKTALAVAGLEPMDEKLDSTDEERNSFGMNAPTPRTRNATPSG